MNASHESELVCVLYGGGQVMYSGCIFFVVVVVQKTLPAMSGNEVKSKATAET